MLYTVTANPSLDYYMMLTAPAKLGQINRSERETIVASGKGVNVSVLLHRLGCKTCALGFLAGESGRMYQKLLTDCPNDFVFTEKGMTRINVKIYAEEESAFNAAGPEISRESYAALCEKLSALTKNDMLILSGNLQKNAPFSYAELAAFAEKHGAEFVADTTGAALLSCLSYRPYLIKPNLEELGELFSLTVRDRAHALALCRKLQEKGARNVLVSMGGDGAVLLTEQGEALYAVCEKSGEVVSTVGAGDSVVAGFLCAAADGKSPADALRLGIAAGTATVYAGKIAEKAQVEALLPYIKVTKL